jgi:hypothetical protein
LLIVEWIETKSLNRARKAIGSLIVLTPLPPARCSFSTRVPVEAEASDGRGMGCSGVWPMEVVAVHAGLRFERSMA